MTPVFSEICSPKVSSDKVIDGCEINTEKAV